MRWWSDFINDICKYTAGLLKVFLVSVKRRSLFEIKPWLFSYELFYSLEETYLSSFVMLQSTILSWLCAIHIAQPGRGRGALLPSGKLPVQHRSTTRLMT